ncbi:MAG: cytochrome c3 family protein [Chloroflexota bacterium]
MSLERHKPLGCLSPLGIAAALLTLLLILALTGMQGGRMFSPGGLNAEARGAVLGGVASHAELSGRCAACHTAPWDPRGMSELCLDCHTDLTGDPTNFHRVMLAQSRQSRCSDCHTDHHGGSAALTLLDLEQFPHLAVGYSLQAHRYTSQGAYFTCADCHTAGLAVFDVQVCSDCHAPLQAGFLPAHIDAFGGGCLACHDGVDRYGAAFDHNRLAFQLLGRHAGMSCVGCHAGARSPAELQDAPAACAACHLDDDAHQGQFGRDCAGCHTPESWQQADFDHSLTAFKLDGAHARVACEACHANGRFKGTPVECRACHAEPARHQGLFPGGCAECHTVAAWTPAQFNAPHRFPIDHGEGGLSACTVCHPDSLQGYTCYGCHEHNPAEIEAKHREEGIADFADCMACHPTGQEEEGGEHD